jgi:putative FmdB family regulatory protein
MPTYEYACRSCGRHLEVFQRISEEPLSVCPNCGGALRKVYHPAGILLKGSGFYKTDSRAKTSDAKSSKSSESSSSSSSSSGSSDSSSGSSSESSSAGSSSGSSSGGKEKSA